MSRGLAMLVLLVGACTSAPAADDDAGTDAAGEDAGIDAARRDSGHDAGRDAAGSDVGPPLRDPHPMCGVRSYDVDDPTTYDTREELALALADARCALQVRYGILALYCAGWGFEQPTAYRADFDVALARTCLLDIDAAAWGVFNPPSCDGLIQPATGAPLGAACGAESSCGVGTCSEPTGICTGTCVPRSCPACTPDEYCALYAGRCFPRPGRGELCAGGICADDLGCDPITGMCVYAPVEGEPCAMYFNPYVGGFIDWCRDGFRCNDVHTCVLPTIAAVGETCGGTRICEHDIDCLGGVCFARPARGEPCQTSGGPCAPGLMCNASNRCGAPVGPGCACDDTTTCPYGNWCHRGVCTSMLVVSPPHCTSYRDCSGAACVAGRCDVHDYGASCIGEGDCLLGHCGHDLTCVPDIPVGSDCTRDIHCVPMAQCLSGVCALAETECYTPPD